MKSSLFIIAPQKFRDEELFEPISILEKAGIGTTVASIGVKLATGVKEGVEKVDLDIRDVNVMDYDAIIFIGGPGATIYFDHDTAHQIAKDALTQEKLLAAICIAPSILANAGVLNGVKATSFPSELDNLIKKGALVQSEDLVVDGKIITASGPNVATQFGQKILELLV